MNAAGDAAAPPSRPSPSLPLALGLSALPVPPLARLGCPQGGWRGLDGEPWVAGGGGGGRAVAGGSGGGGGGGGGGGRARLLSTEGIFDLRMLDSCGLDFSHDAGEGPADHPVA